MVLGIEDPAIGIMSCTLDADRGFFFEPSFPFAKLAIHPAPQLQVFLSSALENTVHRLVFGLFAGSIRPGPYFHHQRVRNHESCMGFSVDRGWGDFGSAGSGSRTPCIEGGKGATVRRTGEQCGRAACPG